MGGKYFSKEDACAKRSLENHTFTKVPLIWVGRVKFEPFPRAERVIAASCAARDRLIACLIWELVAF